MERGVWKKMLKPQYGRHGKLFYVVTKYGPARITRKDHLEDIQLRCQICDNV